MLTYFEDSQKADARLLVRGEVNGCSDPEMDFMFQPQYQSSDESEDEGPDSAIDPGSDFDEPAGTVKTKSTAYWVVHPPTYRTAKVRTYTFILTPYLSLSIVGGFDPFP